MQMNKAKLFVLSLLSVLFSFYTAGAGDLKGYEYKLDKIYPIDADGTLHLKTNDADIRIVGSNRSDVHLKVFRSVNIKGIFSSNEENFRIDVEDMGGDLIVREIKRSYRGGVTIQSDEVYKITIEVPNSISLKLRGDDDNYHISNIGGMVKINVDDGDVMLDNCSGSSIDLDIEDGNIEMSGAKGQLWVTLDDGDLYASDCEFEKVEIRGDDADIHLETSLASNGDYSLRVDDGNLNLQIRGGGGDFDIRHDDGRIRASGDFDLTYSGETRHEFKLTGGNAKVFVKTDDGNVELNTY